MGDSDLDHFTRFSGLVHALIERLTVFIASHCCQATQIQELKDTAITHLGDSAFAFY